MRMLAILFASLAAIVTSPALSAAGSSAGSIAPVIAYDLAGIEQDVPHAATERTVRLALPSPAVTESVTANDVTFEAAGYRQTAPVPDGIARFGPFRVLDATTVALVDVTDSRSPAQFAALLRAYPAVRELRLIECPGTEDDVANLQVGRMIRAHGIVTHVPAGGSVRSGGVELFLAGSRRIADPGAEFAVHSWQDEDGREPGDYAANSPENRRYTDYYREMGMSPAAAAAFYAMTNSVPFDSARWFGPQVMAEWVALDQGAG